MRPRAHAGSAAISPLTPAAFGAALWQRARTGARPRGGAGGRARDGTASRGLRKDNTGYDLKDLFVGSEGTLGIITAAVLKLFPKPKARATAFIGCTSPQAALDLFQRLRAGAGDLLTVFEYMPQFALDIVLKHVNGAVRPLAGQHHSYALIELTSPQGDADLQGVFETILGQAIEDEIRRGRRHRGERGAAQRALATARGTLRRAAPRRGSIKHDVSVPVSCVADFIEEATQACEAVMPEVRVCAFGHFGDGNIHFNLSQPVGMDKSVFLGEWERFNHVVHDIVARMNGSISAEHGVGLIKRDELLLYKDPVAIDLMRTLKRSLDPQNILNPGKVVAVMEGAPPALPLR